MENTTLFYSTGQIIGVTAYLSLAFLIFLGDTARYWDRYFGLDKIIRFQRKFSFVVFGLVLLHPVLLIASFGFKNIIGYILPNLNYFGHSIGVIALYIYIFVMLSSYFYKRISYNVWQYIHILTYVLIFGALTHAILIGSDSKEYSLLYVITAILIIVGIVYRTKYKIVESRTNKHKIINIIKETEDTYTLVLEKKNTFNFKAGQFCFIRIDGKKLYARHPFTISSAPSENVLKFTIKLAGQFTKTAIELSEGDTVILDGPFGKFTPENYSKNDELVFFAGGVGITPFISIIKEAVLKNSNQKITLFYASKTEKDIIFKNELDTIKNDWFKKIYFLSKEEKIEDGYENGYFTEELIKKHAPNIMTSRCFICGPEPMKEMLISELKNIGVKNIHKEDFFW